MIDDAYPDHQPHVLRIVVDDDRGGLLRLRACVCPSGFNLMLGQFEGTIAEAAWETIRVHGLESISIDGVTVSLEDGELEGSPEEVLGGAPPPPSLDDLERRWSALDGDGVILRSALYPHRWELELCSDFVLGERTCRADTLARCLEQADRIITTLEERRHDEE